LGWLWAFAPPLVLTISFTRAGQAEIFNIGNTPVPYPLFALIGTVLWQSFTEAIQGPIQSCHQARTLLTRIRFPYEAILISKAADVALNSLLRLLLVAAAMAWYQVGPGWTVLLLPLAMAALLGLGTALGMALAPLATIVDDIKHGLNVVLSVWFFVTPIMYHQPAAGSAIATLNRLNPVTPLLATSRAWLLGLETPTPVGFAVLAGVIPLLLLVSWVFFRMSIPIAVERIGA
jgi:lipopolysaccharide transport system permease protein